MNKFITIFGRRMIDAMKANASNPLPDDKAQESEESEKIMLKSAETADKKINDLEHELEELKLEIESIKNSLDS